jgi:hypothetical protein
MKRCTQKRNRSAEFFRAPAARARRPVRGEVLSHRILPAYGLNSMLLCSVVSPSVTVTYPLVAPDGTLAVR